MHSLVSAAIGATASSPTATASLPSAPASTLASSAALCRFVVANGIEAELKAAFRGCPKIVGRAAGFVCGAVLCPLEGPREICLATQWRHASDYRAWHHGYSYRDSRRGIPKGLKLVDRDTSIREFDAVWK
jgi:heme-degrading monooxygenase HmoA